MTIYGRSCRLTTGVLAALNLSSLLLNWSLDGRSALAVHGQATTPVVQEADQWVLALATPAGAGTYRPPARYNL